MEVQFQIPLSRNDLLSCTGEYYAVKEIFSVREIGSKLEGMLRPSTKVPMGSLHVVNVRNRNYMDTILLNEINILTALHF